MAQGAKTDLAMSLAWLTSVFNCCSVDASCAMVLRHWQRGSHTVPPRSSFTTAPWASEEGARPACKHPNERVAAQLLNQNQSQQIRKKVVPLSRSCRVRPHPCFSARSSHRRKEVPSLMNSLEIVAPWETSTPRRRMLRSSRARFPATQDPKKQQQWQGKRGGGR